MNLGVFVKTRRSNLGLSLDKVADAAGLSKPTVNDIERGIIVNAQVKTLVLLAKGLRVKPQIIFEAALVSINEEREKANGQEANRD